MLPGDPGLAARRFPPPPPLLLNVPETRPRGAMAAPLYDKEMVSPLETWQGTQLGQGASLLGVGQFPLRQYPMGKINQEGQPAGHYWTHTLFSTSYLLN